MADEVDLYEARYDTSHVQSSAEAAARKVEALEREIQELNRSFQGGGGPGLSAYNQRLGELEKQLAAAERQASAVGVATARAAGGAGNFAQGLLQAGRGIQDFQAAGVAGVVNNVEGLAFALGGGAGLAGVATVAAVGVQLLTPAIKDLYNQFTASPTMTEAEAMKALEENTARTAEETRKLVAIKERQQALEGIGARPKATAETERAAQTAIAEFGRPGETGQERIVKGLVESRFPGGVPLLQEGQERIEKFDRNAAILRSIGLGGIRGRKGSIEEERAAVLAEEQEKATTAAVDDARKQLGGILSGQLPGGLQGLIRQVERNPGAFPEGLAGSLRAATPEGRAAAEEAKRQAEERAQAEQAAARERQQAEARAAAEKQRAEEAARREKEQAEEAVRREQERRAAELAKNLGPSLDIEALSGKRVGRDRVQEALIKSQGLAPDEAAGLAGPVLKDLAANLQERLRTRAGAEGISFADAGRAILADAEKKRAGAAAGIAPDQAGRLLGGSQSAVARLFSDDQVRRAETMSSTAYLESIQGGVRGGGQGDFGRQQVDLLRSLEQKTAQLVQNTQRDPFGGGATF